MRQNSLMCLCDMKTSQIFNSVHESNVLGLSISLRLQYTQLFQQWKLRYNIQNFACFGANSCRHTLTSGKSVVTNPSIDRNVFGKAGELLQIASNLLKTNIN